MYWRTPNAGEAEKRVVLAAGVEEEQAVKTVIASQVELTTQRMRYAEEVGKTEPCEEKWEEEGEG